MPACPEVGPGPATRREGTMVRQSGSASSADLLSVDLGDGKLRRAFLCPKRELDLVRVIGRLRCCRPIVERPGRSERNDRFNPALLMLAGSMFKRDPAPRTSFSGQRTLPT